MSGKNTGEFDFSGQESRDGTSDTPEKEAREVNDHGRVNYSKQHNPHNGSGGTKRTIAPGSVKGSNP